MASASGTTSTTPPSPSLAERVRRSKLEWRLLATRLSTITPRALARGAITTTGVLAVAWLMVSTWPALLPYALGGIVAYAVYPLVGILDRYMPRLLAATVATVVGFGAIVGVLAVVLPPLAQQGILLLTNLPQSSDVARLRTEVNDYIATMPETTQRLAHGVLDRMAGQVQQNLTGLLDLVATAAVQAIFHIFGTIGSVLGMAVLPIWALYVVRDGDQVTRTIERQLAPSIRPDVMALVRIVDRAVGTFLRLQVASALLVGAGVWIGMALAERAGVATFNSEMAIAGFAGAVQVLPQVGWLLGLLPAAIGLITRPDAPVVVATYVAMYAAVVRLAYLLAGKRMGRVLSIRASVAIPGVVLLSGLGLAALLLSSPILVIARDTVLYLRGRLADPPQPAGVLPGSPVPATQAHRAPYVPPLYRAASRTSAPAASSVAKVFVTAPAAGPSTELNAQAGGTAR